MSFLQSTGVYDEPSSLAELDRYTRWPGQGLSYKVGQLWILKLRDHAQRALGEHFDLAAFHEEVLQHGDLPLLVLQADLLRWEAGRLRRACSGRRRARERADGGQGLSCRSKAVPGAVESTGSRGHILLRQVACARSTLAALGAYLHSCELVRLSKRSHSCFTGRIDVIAHRLSAGEGQS